MDFQLASPASAPTTITAPNGTYTFPLASTIRTVTIDADIDYLKATGLFTFSGAPATSSTPAVEPALIVDGVLSKRNPVGNGYAKYPTVQADAAGVITDGSLGAEQAGLSAGFRAEVCPPPLAGVFANSDRTITNTGATRCYMIRHAPVLARKTSKIQWSNKVASTADDGVCFAGYDLSTGQRLWTTGRVLGKLNSTGKKYIPIEIDHDPARPIVVAAAYESANATGATVFGRSIGAADTIDIFVPEGLTPSFANGKLIGFADGVTMPLPATMPTPLANNVNTVPLIIFSEV